MSKSVQAKNPKAKAKREKAVNHNRRSMDYLRELDYTVAKVETTKVWTDPETKKLKTVRVDLFGVFDFIAFDDRLTLLVQVTDASHRADRRKKILRCREAERWVRDLDRRIWLLTWNLGVRDGRQKYVENVELIGPHTFAEFNKLRDARMLPRTAINGKAPKR